MFDVIIVGAGAAGFGCALTLSSVENTQEWGKNKKYLMIDDNNSDIKKASFFNLTGVEFGIGGDKLLNNMKSQLNKFKSCEYLDATTTSIKKKDGVFTVVANEVSYETKIVVLATGMHKFNIECEFTNVLEHTDVMKPNKVCLEHSNNKITEGLYVAGLASGVKTMFAIANGEGTKVACDIFKLWTSKPAVAHDTIKDKIV